MAKEKCLGYPKTLLGSETWTSLHYLYQAGLFSLFSAPLPKNGKQEIKSTLENETEDKIKRLFRRGKGTNGN